MERVIGGVRYAKGRESHRGLGMKRVKPYRAEERAED